MIVRRLCVTPAVGSLMQWLLTRRNRTTERTNREPARQQHGIIDSILKESQMSQKLSEDRAAGKDAAAAARTAEAHPGGGARRGAAAAGLGGGPPRVGADVRARRPAICGFVWNDTNNNGIQDAGEPAIEGAKVTSSSPRAPTRSTRARRHLSDGNRFDGFYYLPRAARHLLRSACRYRNGHAAVADQRRR